MYLFFYTECKKIVLLSTGIGIEPVCSPKCHRAMINSFKKQDCERERIDLLKHLCGPNATSTNIPKKLYYACTLFL